MTTEELNIVTKQRDSLLAACKAIVGEVGDCDPPTLSIVLTKYVEQCKAAIALAEPK